MKIFFLYQPPPETPGACTVVIDLFYVYNVYWSITSSLGRRIVERVVDKGDKFV